MTEVQCYLCEDAGRPTAAVCHRCGAFVCKEHSVRLVHRPRRMPVGLMSPASRERYRRLEILCETCNLNELAAVESARDQVV